MSNIDFSGSGQVVPDPLPSPPAFEVAAGTAETPATVLPTVGTVTVAAIDLNCVSCGMHLTIPAGGTYPISASCSLCGASWTVT